MIEWNRGLRVILLAMAERKGPSLPKVDPPTKDQRIELIRRRLVPAQKISRLTSRQAAEMIFRDRRRSARRRACSAAVLAVVFALGGVGVYEVW